MPHWTYVFLRVSPLPRNMGAYSSTSFATVFTIPQGGREQYTRRLDRDIFESACMRGRRQSLSRRRSDKKETERGRRSEGETSEARYSETFL